MRRRIGTVLILVTLIPAQAAENKHHSESLPAGEHQPDTRVLVSFSDATKTRFLKTMRENLADVNDINRAIAESDFERAAHIAEFNLGLGSIKTHNALAVDMPIEMQNLGMTFHEASSQLALTLKEKDMAKAIDGLANVTQVCVMCHATYRVR